jgi:ectoine hydroxylase-related dioxygenase (phytanoyl-CoA dioxygenase family)
METTQPPRTEDVAAILHAQGYFVLEDAFSAADVESFRAPLARKYAALGEPKTWSNPPLVPAEDVEISIVGLVLYKLGRQCPEIVPRLITPEVVDVARQVLGDDMHLEFAAAVLNHDDRPFFHWHMHVGGVDNPSIRHTGKYPRFQRCERLTTLLYLDDLTDESGTLLVLPRRIDEPTAPPFDTEREPWEGQVELRCRRGTVVFLEQCTWHAARPKRSPGLRAFIACYFTSSRAAATVSSDDSLAPLAGQSPLLAALLAGPRS